MRQFLSSIGIHPWYIVEGRMESDFANNRKQVTAIALQ
jgi:hypothetical protein